MRRFEISFLVEKFKRNPNNTGMELAYFAQIIMLLGIISLLRFDSLRFSICPSSLLSSQKSVRIVQKVHHFDRNQVFDSNKHNFRLLQPLFVSSRNNLEQTNGRKGTIVVVNNENDCFQDGIVKQHFRSAASYLSAIAVSLSLIIVALPQPSVAAFSLSSSFSSSFSTSMMTTLVPSILVSSASSAEVIIDPVAADRFRAALRTLQTLDEQWDSLVRGQGDNVRRQLGRYDGRP